MPCTGRAATIKDERYVQMVRRFVTKLESVLSGKPVSGTNISHSSASQDKGKGLLHGTVAVSNRASVLRPVDDHARH